MIFKTNCPCNLCAANTIHSAITINDHFETLTSEYRIIDTIVCDGCKAVSVRTISTVNDKKKIVSYEPPRSLFFERPWFPKLARLDPTLYGLMNEVYSVANERSSRLVVMGLRAALDHLMTTILGDIGGFSEKLYKMEQDGHISTKQRELLETVIAGASATSHRGYRPKWNFVEQMVFRVESLIEQHYIADPELQKEKANIPKRKKK